MERRIKDLSSDTSLSTRSNLLLLMAGRSVGLEEAELSQPAGRYPILPYCGDKLHPQAFQAKGK